GRFRKWAPVLEVHEGIIDAPDRDREKPPAADHLDVDQPARGVLLGMIDAAGRTFDAIELRGLAAGGRRSAMDAEVGRERAQRYGAQHGLCPEEQPALATLAVLEL